MNDRNNAFNPNHDPPYYNVDYGMQEGAQTCASVLTCSPLPPPPPSR